jgi:hypothetical protein
MRRGWGRRARAGLCTTLGQDGLTARLLVVHTESDRWRAWPATSVGMQVLASWLARRFTPMGYLLPGDATAGRLDPAHASRFVEGLHDALWVSGLALLAGAAAAALLLTPGARRAAG